jgi:hypothetical protein
MSTMFRLHLVRLLLRASDMATRLAGIVTPLP